MANFLSDFIKIFNKITRLYGEILDVCKKKQSFILENNINGLETLLQREGKLLDAVIY